MHSGVYFEVLATGARVGWRPRWDPNFNHSFNTSKCSNQKSIEPKNHHPIRFKKSYRTTYCLKPFKAICFLTLRRSALTALRFWPLKLDCETHRRDKDIIFFYYLVKLNIFSQIFKGGKSIYQTTYTFRKNERQTNAKKWVFAKFRLD